MSVGLDQKFLIEPQIVSRSVGDETVILSMTSGTYFGLNPVGARIWQLIAEGRDLRDVCLVVADEFDAPAATIESDVLELLAHLQANGLIRPVA